MKRIISVLAVAALMAVMLVAPGVAGAQEEPNVSQRCKDGLLIGSGHGGCVAFNSTPFGDQNTTANAATSCRDQNFRDLIGAIPVTNRGQCVKAQGQL